MEKVKDTIYRQDAIDEIEYELEMINSALDSTTLDFNARERLRQRRGEAREILNSIQQLPSAQPEQRWIPCRERLPEKTQLCLVTEKTVVGLETCTRCFNKRHDGGFWSGWGHTDVIAWMPLPKLYKEEQDG